MRLLYNWPLTTLQVRRFHTASKHFRTLGTFFNSRTEFLKFLRSVNKAYMQVHIDTTIGQYVTSWQRFGIEHLKLVGIISPNSTWLVTSRFDTTRQVRRVERVETTVSIVSIEPCCSNMANDKQAIVLAYTSLVVFMLFHTQILFVPANEINEINIYLNKLVNNLHIITLYKLHTKLLRVAPVALVVSSVSSRALRQARHSQNAWAQVCSTRRTCRVVSRRDEPSGIWAIL